MSKQVIINLMAPDIQQPSPTKPPPVMTPSPPPLPMPPKRVTTDQHKPALIKPRLLKIIQIYFILIIVVIIASVAALTFFKDKIFNPPLSPATYTECLKAPGSNKKNDMCITKSGEEFAKPPKNTEDISAVSPTTSPITEWKDYSYTSGDVNFSFKYPSNWPEVTIQEVNGRTKIEFPSKITFEYGKYLISGQEITYEQFIERNRPPARTVISYTLDGIKGKRFLYQQGNEKPEILIAIPRENNSIFTINYTLSSTGSSAENQYYQIISGFRFNGSTTESDGNP